MLQSYSSNWAAPEVPQLQNEFQNNLMLQSSPSLNPPAPGVPRIQNVVSTVDLGCKLDLKYIALKARNAEYNPRRFGAVIMRIRDPKTTALIFSSGKLVVTGAKSASSSNLAVRKYARIVAKMGPNKSFELMEKKEKISFENGVQQAVKRSFKVHNLVASCDVGFTIGLEKLQAATSYFTIYDPELFPGLIFRLAKPKVTLLVFVSGKVVITGAKDFNNDTLKAWELVYPIIVEHRKYCQS